MISLDLGHSFHSRTSSVLVSCGCSKKFPQTLNKWIKITSIFLQFWRSTFKINFTGQKSRCVSGWGLLLGALRQNLLRCLSQLLDLNSFTFGPFFHLQRQQAHILLQWSQCPILLQSNLCLPRRRTFAITCKAQIMQDNRSISRSLTTSAKSVSRVKQHSHIPGVGTWVFLRAIIQCITHNLRIKKEKREDGNSTNVFDSLYFVITFPKQSSSLSF